MKNGTLWPALIATGLYVLADVASWSHPVPHTTQVLDPCVAFMFVPEIPGYAPKKMKGTLVWLDGPIFDLMFKDCHKPGSELLAVTPDNQLIAMRKGFK